MLLNVATTRAMCSRAAGRATDAFASPEKVKMASRRPLRTLYVVRPMPGIMCWTVDWLLDQQDNPRQMIDAPNS